MRYLRPLFSSCVMALALTAGPVVFGSAPQRTIAITGDDSMKFSVTTIQAKPGETIQIKLSTKSTLPAAAMSHNFVLLKTATNVDAFVTAAVMARATDYIPAKLQGSIIASTALAGPGEMVTVTFKAPAVPGIYPYLCTFPGHYAAGMKGTLVVK
jgi:azurin